MPEQLKLSALTDASRTRFWPALTIFLICVCVSFGLIGCNSGDRTTGNGTEVASSSPAANTNPARSTTRIIPTGPVVLSQEILDTTVKTLDGSSLKLSDYDDKVLILNLWATWCGPCRQEMPELVKMSTEYKSRGLVVLGIATEYNERQGQDYVKDFIRANGINYKVIWDDGTLAGPLVQAMNGRPVIPQSFVISRDGKITKHFSGFNALSTPALMRQAVEEALNDKSKA